MKTERKTDDWISDLVGALSDPIIVFESPWKDTLPEWIKPAITMERLIMNMKAAKGEKMTGTDAEALAYMYPRTLEAPLGSDWTQIYLYLGTKVIPRHEKREMPDDIKTESLTGYQMDKLNHLKDWIYDVRIKVRKDRERGERREAKEEKKQKLEVLGKQTSLF